MHRGFGLLTFITLFALSSNEAWGGTLIQVAVITWAVYCACYLQQIVQLCLRSGPVIWLVPGLCLLSTLWSIEPLITFRGALQDISMVVFTIVFVQYVPVRYYLMLLFTTLALIALISIPINNEVIDGDTYQVNLAGIFTNKNTFATSSAILVMVSFAIMLDRSVKTGLRLLMLPFIALGAWQNLYAGSVASSVALAVAVCWSVALFSARLVRLRYRKAYISFLAVGGLISFALGSAIVLTFSDVLLEMVGKNPTLTGRTVLWGYAQQIIDRDPFGLGFGFMAFWVPGHSMAENLWHMMKVPSGSGFSFHNLYYQVRIDLGLLGVLGTLITITATLSWVLKWVRGETTPQSIFFFTLYVFIIVIQTQGVDLFTTYNACYAIFLAMMVYSRTWVQRDEARQRQHQRSMHAAPQTPPRLA